MALLDDVIDSSGGTALWKKLSRFTLHLSIGGTLFAESGHHDYFKDVIGEGSLKVESVRFTGIARGERYASFRPDVVTIETLDGKPLGTWSDPGRAFLHTNMQALTNELNLIFFCGVTVWNYIATPLLLVHPNVIVEELPPWRDGGETWRRLRAQFPPSLITLASEQVFYFDERAFQRRNDHDLLGMKVAHHSWAHQKFGGIVMPTLRRTQIRKLDGTVSAKPVLIDVEIFDASFD